MDISWLGHSCLRLRGSHATVITDPYSPSLGYSLGKPTARIVTVSHQHDGHSYVQGVGEEPRQVIGPGEYEIGGVLIIGIATFHDMEKGEQAAKEFYEDVYDLMRRSFGNDFDRILVCVGAGGGTGGGSSE